MTSMANLRSPTVKSYLAAFGIGGRFGVPVRRARTESAASEKRPPLHPFQSRRPNAAD